MRKESNKNINNKLKSRQLIQLQSLEKKSLKIDVRQLTFFSIKK